MLSERASVGLDVHARSAMAHSIDQVTGEVVSSRPMPDGGSVIAWLAGLPGTVATLYEAGPTGFGLARELRSAGYRCAVAASSKLQRPSGDRVKTDARDAEKLSRLLRLDEFTAVTVPDEATEAARDLVRARGILIETRTARDASQATMVAGQANVYRHRHAPRAEHREPHHRYRGAAD